MPFNHRGNRANGIVTDGMRTTTLVTPTTLTGRLTGLQIYEIRISTLISAGTGGPNFIRLVQSMEKDNMRDLRKRGVGMQYADLTRQPTDHNDVLGNLPVVPPRLGYREYNIPGNRFTWPNFPRLVADVSNKRLYLTPTHYDTWFDNEAAANGQPVGTAGGNRSPFLLLSGVAAYNDLFD